MYELIKAKHKTIIIIILMSVKVCDLMKYILKYQNNQISFINAISKWFETCMNYEMIPYIWKTSILIQH